MTYLSQSAIAGDASVQKRVMQAAAENGIATDAGMSPESWALEWKQVWASAPGWDEAWDSALAAGIPDPGSDPTVITDAMINAQVQSMMPFTSIPSHRP